MTLTIEITEEKRIADGLRGNPISGMDKRTDREIIADHFNRTIEELKQRIYNKDRQALAVTYEPQVNKSVGITASVK